VGSTPNDKRSGRIAGATSLRIAMFVHTLDDRAVSRVVVSVCGHLAAQGFEVVVICATRAEATVDIPDGVRVEDLAIGSRTTIFALARLARRLRAVRPDVLFAHLNGPGRAAVVARRLARVPTAVVVVEHAHYDSFYRTHRWARDRLTAVLYPRADCVAGVAPQVVDDLVARFPRIRHTAVLPSIGPDAELGVQRPALPHHDWYRDSTAPVVCSVGNLVARKGQATLVEALQLVHKEIDDLRLVLVGRFDDEVFVARLRELAAELGVQDHVLLAGYHADALPYIAHADAFALASTTEGMPMVLVEAMALGVPVVATDCPGGVPFVVDGGRCGQLVPVGDPEAMASALVAAVRESPMRDERIAAGRARAPEFSPPRVASRYAALAQAWAKN
jgi:glycosyltransferase involved in cell wall biosynthesis